MLQRTLGSGWGVLLPGLLIAGLMYADLSPDQWRIVILMGLVLTPAVCCITNSYGITFCYHRAWRYCWHHADDNELNQG